MAENPQDTAVLEDEVIARLEDHAPPTGTDIGSHGLVVETFGSEEATTATVLVHGGFWRPGIDRTHLRAAAHVLADHGFRVALPEYRREPGNPMGSLADLLAVDELLTEQGWYGQGPVAGVWVGHSAGGTLALLRAMEPGRPEVAAVSLAGVTDLTRGAREGLGHGAVTDWVGAGPDEAPEAYDHLDPRRRWADAQPVDAVLVHGADDATVPVAHSEDFDAPTHVLPGAHHADLIDPDSPHWHHVHTAFLEAYSALWQRTVQ